MYRLGVMYLGALGIRLLRGLPDWSGWGILDGVCRGEVTVEMVVEDMLETLAGEGNLVGLVILLGLLRATGLTILACMALAGDIELER